jgi:ribosomal protein L7/L12
MILTEVLVALGIVVIIVVARRYSVSDPIASRLPAGTTQADIAELVKAGRTIEAIKLYRRLHGTDLKTAKDAIDKIRAQQAGEQSRTER